MEKLTKVNLQFVAYQETKPNLVKLTSLLQKNNNILLLLYIIVFG
jgi:hypothetical protein